MSRGWVSSLNEALSCGVLKFGLFHFTIIIHSKESFTLYSSLIIDPPRKGVSPSVCSVEDWSLIEAVTVVDV